MTLVFDTLSYARKLQDAGFTEAQARAQAEALAEIASENLATKSDIAALQRDMKEMETGLRAAIGKIDSRPAAYGWRTAEGFNECGSQAYGGQFDLDVALNRTAIRFAAIWAAAIALFVVITRVL
jgi:hypothetical protein